jgi:hypothetical protein
VSHSKEDVESGGMEHERKEGPTFQFARVSKSYVGGGAYSHMGVQIPRGI